MIVLPLCGSNACYKPSHLFLGRRNRQRYLSISGKLFFLLHLENAPYTIVQKLVRLYRSFFHLRIPTFTYLGKNILTTADSCCFLPGSVKPDAFISYYIMPTICASCHGFTNLYFPKSGLFPSIPFSCSRLCRLLLCLAGKGYTRPLGHSQTPCRPEA